MTENLFECIRAIRQRYNKYGQFQQILDQKASSRQQMQQKIRGMSVAFQVIAEQNAEVMRLHNNLLPIIDQKDRQIQLKELEVKKYREQILDLSNKNEELSNYCRKLANQYTILLNSIKDCQETALKRQASAYSKLKMMQNQVCFLRNNILKKKQPQNIHRTPLQSTSRRIKSHNVSNSKQKRTKTKRNQKQNSGPRTRKSLIHQLV